MEIKGQNTYDRPVEEYTTLVKKICNTITKELLMKEYFIFKITLHPNAIEYNVVFVDENIDYMEDILIPQSIIQIDRYDKYTRNIMIDISKRWKYYMDELVENNRLLDNYKNRIN